MKIISVANQKGGCGKTTLAVNIAAALSRLGSETLLIDLDPQGHATFAMGYAKESSEKKTSYDIFRTYFDNESTPFSEMVISDRTRLSFIPANMMLSAAEINLGGVNGAASILFKALSDEYFKRFDSAAFSGWVEYQFIAGPGNTAVYSAGNNSSFISLGSKFINILDRHSKIFINRSRLFFE